MEFLKIIQNKYDVYDSSYLTKYLDLCNNSKLESEVYSENHHILPRHLFPEYENFNEFPSNKATMSYRDHAIAHYYLALALNIPSLWNVCFLMFNSKSKLIPKEDQLAYYENIKKNYANSNRKTEAFSSFKDLEYLWNKACNPKAYAFASWLRSNSAYRFKGAELRHLVTKFQSYKVGSHEHKDYGYSEVWDKDLVRDVVTNSSVKLKPSTLLITLKDRGISCSKKDIRSISSNSPRY
ncbi:hypothetical protein VP277E431_P0133 [Vibrio phage 277E43-1]|nr:hypothetical protein VP277E431_P0133 [Vibrio phage 277E43-1]